MRSLFTVLSLLGIAAASGAETHIIQQQNLTFHPQVVTARPGDTIRWERTGGTHNVVNGLPCNEFEEPIFQKMDLTGGNPIAEWVVPNAVYAEIPYFCSVANHCQQGMTGTILIEPNEGSTVHDVAQVNQEFIPFEITVAPGDTVRWTWNNGGHSVDSGNTETCTEDNLFFKLLLDNQHPQVLWVVPEEMPDEIDYLCRFHCEQDHIGKITKDAPCVGDLDGNGQVDGADLSMLLGAWGTDDAIADLTGNGLVDGADLSMLLGAWGGC